MQRVIDTAKATTLAIAGMMLAGMLTTIVIASALFE